MGARGHPVLITFALSPLCARHVGQQLSEGTGILFVYFILMSVPPRKLHGIRDGLPRTEVS